MSSILVPGNLHRKISSVRTYVEQGESSSEDILFERLLKRMREKIRTRQYVMTVHAEEEEMDEDDLTIFDVEHCILTGEIVDKQRGHETKEWKYLVKGHSITGHQDHGHQTGSYGQIGYHYCVC